MKVKIFDKYELVYETVCNSTDELMDKIIASSKMRKIYGSNLWNLIFIRSKESPSGVIHYNLALSNITMFPHQNKSEKR